MNAFLIVLEVEPHELHKEYEKLPLHCTIMQWFHTGLDVDTVASLMSDIFAQTKPILLCSEIPEMFGDSEDIPVHTVSKNTDLRALHSELLEALNRAGVQHLRPAFIGEGYRPHVTNLESSVFAVGQTHTATSACLVQALQPEVLKQKKVVKKFALSG